MKLAKFTISTYDNYGNILQSFAIQDYFQKQFHIPVETIWYPQEITIANSGNFSSNAIFEFIRCVRLKKFCDSNINIRYDVSREMFHSLTEEYDFFIIGSDIVWNPASNGFMEDTVRFLLFAPPEKRIALAASFGGNEIPESQKEIYRKSLSEFHALSVREETGADIIKVLTGRTSSVLLDPVFWLDADVWKSFEKRPEWLENNQYLLTYFIYDEKYDLSNIAKKLGLQIVHTFAPGDKEKSIISIEEFLYLISHASLFYTNSFHGTAFAIIFETPFYVCERNDAGGERLFTRISSVLNKFQLNSRIFSMEQPEESISMDISFDGIQEVLQSERKKTFEFIKKALNL